MKTWRILAGTLAAIALLYSAGGIAYVQVRAETGPAEMVNGTSTCGAFIGLDLTGDAQASSAYLVGDLNGDGHVDVVDLLTFAETWTKSLGDPGFNPEADFNCDGTIDVVDLLALAVNWGL